MINVISYNVWFLPIFPLTLFSPLVSVHQPLEGQVYKSSYTIGIISIKTVYAIYCIYLTATFFKLNSTLFTVHLDQENSSLIFCSPACVCVFSSHPFWTSSSLDVPAGVTQEEGHTGFLIHLPSAVRALIFVARRIQPFLSLVDREVEFCVLTN